MPASQSVRKPSRVYLRRGHPLTQGLELAMPFFAGAGTTTHDISGWQRHGVLPDGGQWDYEKDIVPSISFGGSINVPWSGVGGSNARSVVMIARNPGSSNETMLGYGTTGNGSRWDFRNESPSPNTGYLRIEVEGGFKYANSNWIGDNWHQIGCVFPEGASNVTDHILYLDGEDDGTQSQSSQSVNTSTSNDINIGSSPAKGRGYSGNIAYVLFYNRGLTPSEMKELYRNPMAPYITKPR